MIESLSMSLSSSASWKSFWLFSMGTKLTMSSKFIVENSCFLSVDFDAV